MRLLLINPWITDYKAYDEWMRPLPFYRFIERYGTRHHITLIDCLDAPGKAKKFGTTEILSTPLEKPSLLAHFPRQYKRYGISLEAFRALLKQCEPPEMVCITALMTYWYQGVQTVVEEVRAEWPTVPIRLGGIYPTLMPDHAARFASIHSPLFDTALLGPPALHPAPLDSKAMRGVLPLKVVHGCPDCCHYCASKFIHNGLIQPEPLDDNRRRLSTFTSSGGQDVVFYDDAPLHYFMDRLAPLLRMGRTQNEHIRFHFPNGMHARMIDQTIADTLFTTGVKTIRLGFERTKGESKVNEAALARALTHLTQAGFQPKAIGVYLLLGPNYSLEEGRATADFLHSLGVRIHINQISPVPGSPLFKSLSAQFPELLTEPLWHNDASWIFTHGLFDWSEVWDFKLYVRSLNNAL